MNILAWILFGLIVGIIADMLDPKANERSLFSALLLGVGGALTGGVLANIFFGMSISGFNLTSFLVAVAGSLLLLLISRTLRRV